MPPPPALKDCPRVAVDLKGELEGFKTSSLKNADTHEKNVLPSAEDVAAAKTEKALIDGIEHFDQSSLKHTETYEKNVLPDKEVVQQEKVHQNLLDGVEHFDKSTMKHATTTEKNILPDPEVLKEAHNYVVTNTRCCFLPQCALANLVLIGSNLLLHFPEKGVMKMSRNQYCIRLYIAQYNPCNAALDVAFYALLILEPKSYGMKKDKQKTTSLAKDAFPGVLTKLQETFKEGEGELWNLASRFV
ncbi:hypothetical protein FQR65_LT09746 [Abscondita terminalis]|nr:hypothetical protein FQR65_LT09746 [Abscondita terminalis]